MRFLFDENFDHRLVPILEAEGHDIRLIGQHSHRSADDVAVLALARKEHRILLTNDQDFGDLIFRRHVPHGGVILFRLERHILELTLEWLRRVLVTYARDLDQFIVVTERGARVRRISGVE